MEKERKWTSYYDEKLNISLEIPINWEIGNSKDFALIFMAPPFEDYRSNVGVNIHGFKNPSKEKFLDAIKSINEHLKKDYPSYIKMEEGEFWIDGFPAYFQQYSWSSPNLKMDFVQTISLIVSNNEFLYEINGTVRKDHKDQFLDDVKRIVSFIRFIKKSS